MTGKELKTVVPTKVYTGDVIAAAHKVGYSVVQQTGKKIVRLFLCHACKEKSMIKAYMKGKAAWYACKCGFRSVA